MVLKISLTTFQNSLTLMKKEISRTFPTSGHLADVCILNSDICIIRDKHNQIATEICVAITDISTWEIQICLILNTDCFIYRYFYFIINGDISISNTDLVFQIQISALNRFKLKHRPEAHGPQRSPEYTAMKAIFSQIAVNVACKKK